MVASRHAVAFALVWALSACSGNRERLIADLQSSRPSDRALAVRKLGESFRAEDLVLFTQAAKDPAPLVRLEATAVLSKSQDSRVVDLLGELLGDDDADVQARAAMALAQVRSDKAKAYLRSQYVRRERATRQSIVAALKAANVPGAMASVVKAEADSIWERNVKALTEGSPAERAGAAEQLGKSGRPEAVNRLVPLLKGTQVAVAVGAARGLGFTHDPRAVAPLVDVLGDTSRELREASLAALAQLNDEGALPRIVEVAKEHSPSSAAAAEALKSFGDSPEVLKALCEVATQGQGAEVSVAATAARRRGACPKEPLLERLRVAGTQAPTLQALASLGVVSGDWVPKVAPLLASSDAQVRRWAAEALGEGGDPLATGPLQKAFDIERKTIELARAKWVRPDALPAGGAWVDPATARLTELADKVGRLNAARLADAGRAVPLETLRDREVVPDVTDDDVKVFAALVSSRGRFETSSDAGWLEPLLVDGNALIRAAAVLRWAAREGADEAKVRAFVADPDSRVSAAAATALTSRGAPGQELLVQAIMEQGVERVRLMEWLKDDTLTPAALAALRTVAGERLPESGSAVSLLGRARDQASVDLLLGLLEARGVGYRREVVEALGMLANAKAAPAVARELYSENPEARAAAADALGKLGPPENLEALDALKGDYYLKVRESAQRAMGQLAGDAGR